MRGKFPRDSAPAPSPKKTVARGGKSSCFRLERQNGKCIDANFAVCYLPFAIRRTARERTWGLSIRRSTVRKDFQNSGCLNRM